MTGARSVLLIGLVAFIAGCCAALMFFDRAGAGDRSRAGSPVSASSPVLAPSDDRLARELLAEIRGLRADLMELTRAGTTREPVAKSNGDAEMLAAMKDLSAALRERSSAGVGEVARANAVRPSSSTGFADVEALLKVKDQDVSTPHYFWTLQRVLDQYGTPSAIYAHDGVLELRYCRGPEGHECCGFSIFDGLVIGVRTNV